MYKFFSIYLLFSCLFSAGFVSASEYKPDHSSPFVYPEYSKKISMDFQDAPLVDVLKIFSKQTNLNLITAESLATKKITIYLDNVPLEEALDQLLRANSLTYEIQPGSNIYIVKPLTLPNDELMTRVYPLKHATVTKSKLQTTLKIVKEGGEPISLPETGEGEKRGITAAISANLTEKGKIIEDPRTNSLIITDIATNFPRIEQTIARLDIPIPQVLIEVEMLEVGKGNTEKIGVKIGETPLSFYGAQRKTLLPWNENELLREGNTWEDNVQYFSGLIDASGLTATLQFLRNLTDTKNLARPRILTLNNEPAQIKITTKEAIGVKTETNSADNLATSSKEAERVETGVILTVTPQVDLETNEITMAIVPRVIQAREGATFEGTTFRDPEERGSQSILRVKNGETIVIGGLLRSDVSHIVTKVPVLGDIPLIGQAFRHTSKTIDERELVIFITPKIISDAVAVKTPVSLPPKLIREQDLPSAQRSALEKELSNYKKRNNNPSPDVTTKIE